MTRILLALLALLGFAAQTAHAEAGMRAMGGAQVRAVQTLGAPGRTSRVAAKSCTPPVMQDAPRIDTCLPVAMAPTGWRAPTVFSRIDRARE